MSKEFRVQSKKKKANNYQLRTNNSAGVSLVELLLGILLIGVMVFLLANLPNAMSLINKSKHISLAREIASKQIEDKRSISYANLVEDSAPVSDSRLSLLPGGSGSIDVSECSEEICTNEENIKEVSVTISWKDNNKDQKITIKTLISEGGLNQ